MCTHFAILSACIRHEIICADIKLYGGLRALLDRGSTAPTRCLSKYLTEYYIGYYGSVMSNTVLDLRWSSRARSVT